MFDQRNYGVSYTIGTGPFSGYYELGFFLDDPELTQAAAAASDGNKELVTALLLEEIICRAVCNADHKTCAFNAGCVRGNYVYLNAAEQQEIYANKPGNFNALLMV